MGLLRSVHEDTPTHPKDNHEVMAKGREVEAARVALATLEARSRELERDRDSSDELRVLTAAHELSDLRQRYIVLKADVLTAQRAYDAAFQKARVPWQQHWQEHYREAAERFLTWLETDALRANDEMLLAQQMAEQAGFRFEPLHIPHLLPEAIAHRARIGRQGLKPS